jgi:uncharacterized protein
LEALSLARIRRIFSFLLLLLLVFLPVIATAGYTENIRDDLGFLSEEELDELQTLIDEATALYDADLVIVITDDLAGKSSKDFADDYYDENGYGIGFDYSGVLLLVNMEYREIWLSTAGKAIRVFTDRRIVAVNNRVADYFSKGEWYQGCLAFIAEFKRYMEEGVPQGQYNENSEYYPVYTPTFWEKAKNQITKRSTYLISLLSSILVTLLVTSSRKKQNTTHLLTYEENDSFKLIRSRDDYLRETTTSVRISSDSNRSSTNRSSTHRSSSGRSHGGGGRKF